MSPSPGINEGRQILRLISLGHCMHFDGLRHELRWPQIGRLESIAPIDQVADTFLVSANAKGSRNLWVVRFHGRLGC